ncbi:cytochrome c oxidase assembly protein [Pseudactinotalea sp.]|uniref:cytochrome c oxidase assembly protein n=1 Tax=Pseudactinotalea sp. TaxID=1926260 RepID=UPI003B3AE6DD
MTSVSRSAPTVGGQVRVWPWVAAGFPTAVLAALVGVAITGASAPTLVGDPGALVRWASPAVGTVIQLATAVTLGGLVMLTFVLPGGKGEKGDGAWRLVRTVVSISGPVWALLAVVELVLGYALVAGRPIGGEGFGDELGFYVTEISTGRAQLVTAVLAALVAMASAAVTGYRSALMALVLGVAVLIPVATQGHAAGSSNHELGMNGIFGHVLGAAVWTGGLAVLALAGHRLGRTAPAVAGRFSVVAAWCFAIVAVSGLASAWIRVGSPAALGTRYGLVLVAKIVLLGALGAAGWWHRRRTIAQLREGRGRLFWRLIGVEVALVGVASGLGVALSGSAPPIEQEPAGVLSPTELLSQRPPPPTPTPENILTAFYPDLFFGFAVAAMLVVYLGWVLRLRRRGDTWPVGRTVAWVAACLVLAYLVLGAPAVYGHVLLSVHMAAHMAYVMVVPILLVTAAPVTLAMRALPARTDGSRGPREWLLGLVHSRWGRLVANPVVAAFVFITTMVAFYFSPLLYLASTTHLGHIGMIVHFVLSGYLFVNGLIGVDPGPTRPGYPMRLILLFATMAAHAFFGVAITTMTELLAADYFGALGLPWGVDALADQRAAGEIAWGIGEIPSLAVAVLLAMSWARDDARIARRKDRAADRDGDAELAAYNEMLSELSDKDRS